MENVLAAVVSLALALAPAPVVPRAEPPDTVAAIEKYLVERKAATETPGLSYALVDRDHIVSTGAWGTDGFGRPMTRHTPVGFGSVAKPVTATAVLRLVDAGRIGLDDPVVDHLPWFRLADQRHAERITVRHLMEQTSGIPAADGYARSDLDDNAPGALRRWVRGLADVEPNAEPGQRHQYGPANAVLLGALAEEVTGLSFADFLARDLFGPLGMADAIADADTAAARLPPGHGPYFGTVRVTDRYFDTAGVPYGYLAGSVTDLAHLAIPLVNGGRLAGRQVLSAAATTDLEHGGAPVGDGRYRLGWRVGQPASLDTTVLWHAGAVTGFHTLLAVAPDAGLGIVVQQNLWSPLIDVQLNAAALGALAIALGETPTPPPDSPTHTLVLVALGALTVGLAAALGRTGWLLATRRRRPARTGRAALADLGWIALGAVPVLGVAVLPGTMGLQPRHVLRFLPDVGQLGIVVAGLGAALVVLRLAMALVGRAGNRPGRRALEPACADFSSSSPR